MHRVPKGKSRIMHASNPNLKFKGKDTGTSDRNNASQLSAMGCVISNYGNFPPPFSVKIIGPMYGDNFGLYTWCLDITGCDELSSVSWEYSVDGINYYTSNNAPFPTPQTSGNYCVSGVLPWNQTLYIRVTATCLDGPTFTDWTAVYNYEDDFPCNPNILEPQSKKTQFMENLASHENFIIYPNPARDILHIDTSLENISLIEVYDNHGRLIELLNRNDSGISQGNTESDNSLNISHYLPGIYFIRANNGEIVVSQSFIKYE
jgi:hypothetical protein